MFFFFYFVALFVCLCHYPTMLYNCEGVKSQSADRSDRASLSFTPHKSDGSGVLSPRERAWL